MSPRTVQQMQPFFSSTASSIACSISRWSSPTAPNSLTITTVSASDGWRSRWFSTVVLPLPRKPVSIVTGTVFAASFITRSIGENRAWHNRKPTISA